jgi:hypothetical protein
MAQRHHVALSLTLAALATAAFWAFRRNDPRGDAAPRTPALPLAPSTFQPQPTPTLREAPPLPNPVPTPTAPTDPPTRTIVPNTHARELAAARWVTGRVLIPPDTPLAERVRVVAHGKSFEHGPAHSADVAADGGFRVAFAPETRNGTLQLEATWLYLEQPFQVALGKADPAPVTLAARLGGRVQGTVIPPPGTDPALLVGRTVTLYGRRPDAGDARRTTIWKSASLGPDLGYAFGGLPVDGRYDVDCDPEIYVPAGVDDFLVEPGGDVRFDLVLRIGATVAGRVVDESGQPLARAGVRADVSGETGWSDAHHRQLLADAAGEFRLTGVAAGNVELHVQAKGFEARVEPLGVLAPGEQRADVEITLVRGHGIAGRVTWPDGTPAADAKIEAELVGSDTPWDSGDSATSDDAGSFELSGLEPGAYRVRASAVKRERVMVTSRLTGKERERTVHETLRAVALDVPVGMRDLALVLAKGLTLRGWVVDDVGAPVTRFKLEYGRRVGAGWSAHVTYDGRRTVSDDDGLFELEGLEPGGLSLRVFADGYLQADAVELDLPRADPLPPIAMLRAAWIAGTVLTPSGAPASGARLEVECAEAFEGLQLGDTSTTRGDGTMAFGLSVGNDGAFELFGFPPASVEIRAAMPGAMASEPLALELAPGERRAGLVLRLSAGARLTGVVLGPDGQPAPRRFVHVEAAEGDFETTVQSEVGGAFALAGLAPGSYALTAEPGPGELEALGFASLAGAATALASRADVDVPAAGAHVVLRPPESAPVRVFGKIRLNGELAAAGLLFYGGPTKSVGSTRAALNGEYAVLLPAPGRYQLTLEPELEGSARAVFAVDVTGPREFRHDVDLLVGGISGRVLGPHGGVAGHPIRATQRADEHGEPAGGWTYGTSDTNGDYAFVGRAAGTWDVLAGGPSNRGWGAARERTRFLTEARADGVRVAPHEMRTGIDLRTSIAGSIAGVVRRADGGPAPLARLYLRNASGAVVDLFVEAQGNGEFELAGLAPGSYLLGATHADQATPSEVAVSVRAEQQTDVALELARGTTIRVHVTDPSGAPRKGHVSCASADGADHSAWFDHDAGDWWDTVGEYRFGPLPRGDYVVTADWEGSKKTAVQVELRGEEAVDVTLVLP